jgi:KDO2-lipid IV(A) lauroyltransferase
MASVKHNLEYYALLSLVKAAHLLTLRMADRFGAGLGNLAHAVLTSRRRVAFDNIKQAMGDSLSDEEINGIVKEVFRGIGRTLIEFSRLSKLKTEGVKRLVVPDGEEILRKVQQEGKGGVIVMPHFGNWELMGAWVAASGYPIDFFVGTLHNPRVNDMLMGFRKETGAGVIPLARSLRTAFKRLRSGRFGALTPDQHDPSGKMIMDLFGRPASMAKGPAVLAIRADCPILPIMLLRERFDRHVMMTGEPIYPPNSGDEEADIRTMTAAYFAFFEKGIREYPDQWMWTHRRWKV